MKSKLLIAALAAVFVSGCTTDPYTGQQKVSNLAASATRSCSTCRPTSPLTATSRR